MKKYITPKAKRDNLVVQELNGEVLIYDLDKNKAFCLNQTSSLVWQLCDGNNTISEISESISRKLDSPANEDLVWLALDQLKKEKLLVNSKDITSDFNGMSRREVVKKVGLASMVALPLVTGLIAPQAIHAASGCVNPGTACSCSGMGTPPTTCQATQCSTNCTCGSLTCTTMGSNFSCTGTCS